MGRWERPRFRYKVKLPDTPEYHGRMPDLEHETTAVSRKQALAAVLARFGCSFLYEEFLRDMMSENPSVEVTCLYKHREPALIN